jgi:hypothetical protein
MDHGMLWYDNQTGQSVELRLEKAIDYFKAKYGHLPLCCFVNPDMLSKPIKVNKDIQVEPNEKVLKNHIWLEIGQD